MAKRRQALLEIVKTMDEYGQLEHATEVRTVKAEQHEVQVKLVLHEQEIPMKSEDVRDFVIDVIGVVVYVIIFGVLWYLL
jgi:hypothetical protein